MSITGNETNWEQLFDNFFEAYGAEEEKKEYYSDGLYTFDKNGKRKTITTTTTYTNGCYIYYKANGMIIYCKLDNDMLRVLMLGFYTESSHLMGFFVNNARYHLIFVQSYFYPDDGKKYRLTFTPGNRETISQFLQIPCEQGWKEEALFTTSLGDQAYQVVATLHNIPHRWPVKMQDDTEYDFGDMANPWLRCVIFNAPWNASKRTSIVKGIKPMNDKNPTS